MSDGYITLIVVGGILAYGFMAGLVFALLPDKIKWCTFRDGTKMIEVIGVLAPIFWPLALPFLLAIGLVNYLKNKPKASIPHARVINDRPPNRSKAA